MTPESQEPLLTHALRFEEAARDDIDEGYDYIAAFSGEAIAALWQDGLFETIGKLATLPYRYPIAPEATALGLPVRGFSYRRPFSGESSPAYRVLYIVDDGQAALQEGPTVTVIMVRHGARRPLTRREGRERRQRLNED